MPTSNWLRNIKGCCCALAMCALCAPVALGQAGAGAKANSQAGMPAPPSSSSARAVSVGLVPADVRAESGFSPSESAGLFVGVRLFSGDSDLAAVPYAVDDAVDLAHRLVFDLDLVKSRRVVLCLSGEPQKPESQARLKALRDAGARVEDATQTSILARLAEQCGEAGAQGLLVVHVATHGFSDQGVDYLIASNSLRRRIALTGIPVPVIFDEVSRSSTKRRVVLLDACRERLSDDPRAGGAAAESAMGRAFAEAVAKAEGQVVLAGTTQGGYAYDDTKRGNGVFTGAILDGLVGEAPADARGFVTAETLAEFINVRVSQWVEKNKPEHKGKSRGIERKVEGEGARLPLAISPKAFESYRQWAARRDQAKTTIKTLMDFNTITAEMVQEVCKALDASDAAKGESLVAKVDLLAQKTAAYSPRDFAEWWGASGGAQYAVARPSGSAAAAEQQPQKEVPVVAGSQTGMSAPHSAAPAVASPLPDLPAIAAQSADSATDSRPSVDIALVAPSGAVPGIELTETPAKSLSRLEAQGGLTFAWRATGEAYGVRYRYRLNDEAAVEDYRRSSVTLSGLEAGRRHTFQVQALTRSGASEPALYAFKIRTNEPPVVEFSEAPAQGALVAAPSVRVKVSGSDPDGQVARYTLVVDDPNNPNRVFENKTGEFVLTEEVLEDSAHRLMAQAVDDSGAQSVPATRDFSFRHTAVTPTPPPTPKPTEVLRPETGAVRSVDLGGGVTMNLVYVRAGSFTMGSPSNESGRDDDEGPQTHVTLKKDFWMGETEVTQAQWRAVMGSDPSNLAFPGNPQNPVERVSWNDAMEFCKRLSEKGSAGVSPAGGGQDGRAPLRFTLPTEAQWEYACRAGSTSRFCFGDSDSGLEEYAWFTSNSSSKTQAVKTKKPNAWGLYDMHGNVWEWCLDWSGSYPGGSVTDPVGPSSGSFRVGRGGSWDGSPADARSAGRGWGAPGLRGGGLGFRVVVLAP